MSSQNFNSIPSLTARFQELGRAAITLNDYLQLLHEEGSFIIPDYQRGYVWGQKREKESVDSVTYLVQSLKKAYESHKEVFLQGITVHGKENSYDIILVDGQQRTTFFYLLLKYLGYEKCLSIKYDIREESNNYLNNLSLSDCSRDEEEEFQDIFFFKRTLRIFERELCNIDKSDFLTFILDNVRFLFIIIPEVQAKIVFTMMNGNKAKMTDEELIKAELLRCASLNDERIASAEHAELRGRLAREWDRWLYWWNDEKIKKYFRTGGRQLGWLLPLILKKNGVTFKDFREKKLDSQNIKQSKATFKEMRLLQKSIEDRYNNSCSYNYIGVIMLIRNNAEQRFAFLRWFFLKNGIVSHSQSDSELKRYYNWCIIGVNHEDIVANNTAKYNEARENFLSELSSNMLFMRHYETGFRWLIRRNIEQDNCHSGRKFNFDIERDRSLEHVYPKSKIGHKNEEGVALNWKDEPIDPQKIPDIKMWREDMIWKDTESKNTYYGSEHSIGNLVLLYKRDNSKFSDWDFRRKNKYFFTDQHDVTFKSRHLIHTTMTFSDINWESSPGNPWNKEQVARRKQMEINKFIEEYQKI